MEVTAPDIMPPVQLSAVDIFTLRAVHSRTISRESSAILL